MDNNDSGSDEQDPNEPYYRDQMTGKEFFEMQVDASNAFEEPFIIKRPTDPERLKALCEMC